MHGGPFDAREELDDRFGGLVSDDLIEEVVDDLESGGFTDWAPVHTDPPDYDEAFELEANAREDPLRFLNARLKEVDALSSATTDENLKPLMRQLLFASMIAALEAYLADTMSFWLTTDKAAFQRFVRGCEEFQKQKLSVSEIYDRIERLEEDVEAYLQALVWHRLDKVGPLMKIALGIHLPDIAELMQHIVIRHDIVHRGGKTKEGAAVTISESRLARLRGSVVSFVEEIEKQLAKNFPHESKIEF